MTLKEAAALLGLSPATLRWQVHHGRLAATKVKGDWLVTEAEVERYGREVKGKRKGAA